MGRDFTVLTTIPLTLCCGAYDRTRALFNGSVKPEGIDLTIMKYSNGDELFRRTLNYGDYDVSELSLSNYIYARELGLNYVAIPVFPSRRFRHADMYVNKRSGISTPSQLNGKKIAVIPSYYVTAAVWQRGFLRHKYGFSEDTATWFTAKEERIPIKFPSKVSVRVTSSIDSMLENAEIDALIGPGKPRNFLRARDIITLFPDPKIVEKEYFRSEGIFPIMHVLVIKRTVWEKNKWIAGSLLDAFEKAKQLWKEYSTTSLGGLVWGDLAKEEEETELGADPYPYNIRDNRKVIETLIQYCSEQAVMQSIPKVEELFVDNAS
jgi:4,5-dihydroxyphthalate decarboxylase